MSENGYQQEKESGEDKGFFANLLERLKGVNESLASDGMKEMQDLGAKAFDATAYPINGLIDGANAADYTLKRKEEIGALSKPSDDNRHAIGMIHGRLALALRSKSVAKALDNDDIDSDVKAAIRKGNIRDDDLGISTVDLKGSERGDTYTRIDLREDADAAKANRLLFALRDYHRDVTEEYSGSAPLGMTFTSSQETGKKIYDRSIIEMKNADAALSEFGDFVQSDRAQLTEQLNSPDQYSAASEAVNSHLSGAIIAGTTEASVEGVLPADVSGMIKDGYITPDNLDISTVTIKGSDEAGPYEATYLDLRDDRDVEKLTTLVTIARDYHKDRMDPNKLLPPSLVGQSEGAVTSAREESRRLFPVYNDALKEMEVFVQNERINLDQNIAEEMRNAPLRKALENAVEGKETGSLDTQPQDIDLGNMPSPNMQGTTGRTRQGR